jgi:hypothetical protein
MAETVRPLAFTTHHAGAYTKLQWASLDQDDSGAPAQIPEFANKTVQVLGTFGVGGSVTLQGSNDGGTTWFTLTDPQGNPLTFTAAGGEYVAETPEKIRPLVTAGDGTTDLTVIVVASR